MWTDSLLEPVQEAAGGAAVFETFTRPSGEELMAAIKVQFRFKMMNTERDLMVQIMFPMKTSHVNC